MSKEKSLEERVTAWEEHMNKFREDIIELCEPVLELTKHLQERIAQIDEEMEEERKKRLVIIAYLEKLRDDFKPDNFKINKKDDKDE